MIMPGDCRPPLLTRKGVRAIRASRNLLLLEQEHPLRRATLTAPEWGGRPARSAGLGIDVGEIEFWEKGCVLAVLRRRLHREPSETW